MNATRNLSEERTCEEHGDYVSTEEISRFTGNTFWSNCPECERRHEERIERENEEDRQRHEREDLERRGIKGRMLDMTFESYDAEPGPMFVAYDKCLQYSMGKPDGNLLLIGSVGTGKTHLGVAVARSHDRGEYTTLMRMIRNIREAYQDKSYSEQYRIDQWATKPLLVIDEVGVQHATNAEQLLIYEVINDRYIQDLPTVLISNETVDGMTEILGERVMDRLAENGRVVAFTWDSYRRRKA